MMTLSSCLYFYGYPTLKDLIDKRIGVNLGLNYFIVGKLVAHGMYM